MDVSSDFDDQTTSHDGLVFASSPGAVQIFDNFKPIGRTQIVRSRPQELLRALSEMQ